VSKTENKNKLTTQEYKYSNLFDTDRILKDLYDSKEFDSQGNIIWTASKIDFPEIPISYDNKYHTSIDSTIYFKDNQGDSCAILILANYNIQLDEGKETQTGSHFDYLSLGVALFTKSKVGWELYEMKLVIMEFTGQEEKMPVKSHYKN